MDGSPRALQLLQQHNATHCNKLQHNATCCNTMRATHCSTIFWPEWFHTPHALQQYICNTLQHIATHYSTLQHTAIHCSIMHHTATFAIHYNTLQHTATQCNMLHHIATHCNTLQHIATYCIMKFCTGMVRHPTCPAALPTDNVCVWHDAFICCLDMGWLRLVGSLKWKISCANEPCKRDDFLQKRPMILRSLLIVATP